MGIQIHLTGGFFLTVFQMIHIVIAHHFKYSLMQPMCHVISTVMKYPDSRAIFKLRSPNKDNLSNILEHGDIMH